MQGFIKRRKCARSKFWNTSGRVQNVFGRLKAIAVEAKVLNDRNFILNVPMKYNLEARMFRAKTPETPTD